VEDTSAGEVRHACAKFEKEEPVEPPPPAPPPAVPTLRSENLAHNIKEATSALGIGRTTIWCAMKDRKLPAVKLSSRTLIKTEALQ
jgi:hypothetical protein